MTRCRCGARCRATGAQSPAFAERGAVTDLDRHALASLIQLRPERIRFVERDRVAVCTVRSKYAHRFTGRKHMTAHVALLTQVFSRPKHLFQHFIPILHRLAVDLHDHVVYNRRPDTFVGQRELNRAVAGIELKDGPHRGAYLLALDPSCVTGNTQSQKPNNGRDHYVVSAGAARLLFLPHGGDHIACRFTVNPSACWNRAMRDDGVPLLYLSLVTRHVSFSVMTMPKLLLLSLMLLVVFPALAQDNEATVIRRVYNPC